MIQLYIGGVRDLQSFVAFVATAPTKAENSLPRRPTARELVVLNQIRIKLTKSLKNTCVPEYPDPSLIGILALLCDGYIINGFTVTICSV